MENIKFCLKEKRMPPEFTVKNFVQGDPLCNYEIYLTEMLNSSTYFLGKLKEGKYRHIDPKSQNHKEPDSIGNGYAIDFKLMESTSLLMGMNIFSYQKSVLYPGVTFQSSPKVKEGDKNYKPINAPILHKVLRDFSLEDIINLSKILDIKQMKQPEKDIKLFIDNLKVQKNLLLFYPAMLYTESSYDFEYAINQISELLWNDFCNSMKFRRLVCNEYETYITFYYEGYFIILQYNNDEFVYIESVNKSKMQTFCHLEKYNLI